LHRVDKSGGGGSNQLWSDMTQLDDRRVRDAKYSGSVEQKVVATDRPGGWGHFDMPSGERFDVENRTSLSPGQVGGGEWTACCWIKLDDIQSEYRGAMGIQTFNPGLNWRLL